MRGFNANPKKISALLLIQRKSQVRIPNIPPNYVKLDSIAVSQCKPKERSHERCPCSKSESLCVESFINGPVRLGLR
jgi:hypothetical protein